VAETRLTLADVADGGYTVEWWDPQSGKVTAREPATAAAGRLVLRLPAIHRDLAAKLSRPAQ
jgi:hypothetical protein